MQAHHTLVLDGSTYVTQCSIVYFVGFTYVLTVQ